MNIYSLIGIIAVLFVFYNFFTKISKDLPLIDLTFLIAGSQWIIAPYLDYITLATHYKYFMYVNEQQYMEIIVPMYIGLIIPFYLLNYDYKLNLKYKDLNKTGLILMVIGTLALLLGKLVPRSSLTFILFLVENLMYVGSGVLILQENKKYKILTYLPIAWLFYSSLSLGRFHDLIIWCIFLFFIFAIKLKLKSGKKIILLTAGVLILIITQSIKQDFREKLAESNNPIQLFTKLAFESLNNGVVESDDQAHQINSRLNQGWIISAIIKHVPKKQAFADGETIEKAVLASILPRFLYSNKKKAGGRENFIKYTGLMISKETSMGLSIIGEAYVNYGKFGGILFMTLWGAFLTLFWNLLMKQSQKNNIALFFIPLIFLQVVKGETEFVVVLNHLIKASMLCYFILWYLQYNYKLSDNAQ